MPESKPKDRWDKLDIVGKLISGVVLALIAVIIKSGTDRIAAAQHRGELVRALIADLTTKDQRTRQDIALIALDHSVGDDNPQLVIEIAERLVLDTTGYSTADRAETQTLGSVAFRVLKKRNPARADSLKHELEQRFAAGVSSDSGVRASLRSDPDTSRPLAAKDSSARAATSLISPVSSNVVFLQFQGNVRREAMERLRKSLDEAGFVAPGVEYIAKPFRSSVRYFYPEDSLQAARAAKISADFLQRERLNAGPVSLQNMSRRGLRVPRGQIEVWLTVI